MTPARALLAAVARTRLGRRALDSMMLSDLKASLLTVGTRVSNESTWDRVGAWPPALRGFDDLTFLLASHRANAGVASLMLNEAAYLYRLVHDLGPATIVEIGRFKGGSTFLLAAAMHPEGRLYSYDPHVKIGHAGADEPLRHALERYGLLDRVTLVVADSKTAEPPPQPLDLVFVDGDHTYEGVKADHERWLPLVRTGGHLLYHDALDVGYAVADAGVVAFLPELRRDERVRPAGEVGSTAHFVKG
jgi:predicted O-methyltransferase YrrM